METIQETKKPMPGRVNQKYIAAQLDVSVATVSKAMRGDAAVNRDTRERILNMAKSLGYGEDNLYAKEADPRKQAQLIGVLVNSSTFRASRSRYLEGLSRELVSAGMAMVTHYVNDSECQDILDSKKQPWVMQKEGGVRGLVLLHHWPENVVIELCRKWPVVSIMHEYPVAGTDYIGVNNSQGIFMLMEKLHGKGHKKIGFFGLSSSLSWARARYAGYMDAACKLDIEVAPEYVVQVEPDYSEKRAFPHWDVHYDYVASQIRNGVRAWMCSSELAAYELYKGLRARGFEVPEDVAVTGFDAADNSGLSDLTMTSIRIHAREMGAGAVRLLISRMNNPSMPRQVLKYDCDFVEGQTI